MEAAIRAANQHTIPFTHDMPSGKFPKEWAERPLAHWLSQVVTGFWADTIVGAAGVGDCFNRISHVAAVAQDRRFPAAVAARAAIRYDAARCNGVCLDELKARSGDQVRACFREACETFDASAADRCLGEEAASSRLGNTSEAAPCGPVSRGARDP